MLVERIIGAFTFRRQVYAEVERDTTFTMTAWLLVAVVAFLNQLGTHASTKVLEWLGSTVVGTIWSVIAFAVAAYIMNWMGRALFKADVNLGELVRTLGLAYVWNVVGVIGVLAGLSDALSCLFTPALVVGWVMLVVSWFVAAKEALDLEVVQTIVTVALGWLVFGLIMAIGSMVLNLIGVTAAGVGRMFGF
ncbi:MAG TPA: hypothetical protein VLY63_06215 [Anaerolineae bacterium]|nr:hypothetical protein [Anaerolineae bacterium]